MATEYFYASTITENAAAGTTFTLAVGATRAECLKTASDTKLASVTVVGSLLTTKILECSAWKRTTDDVALATAIGASDTLTSTSVPIYCLAVLGDPEDSCFIVSGVLRAYDTATQTWSTAGTPRNNAQMDPSTAGYADFDLAGWANSQPTLALIRAAGFTVGFRFALDGSTVSSSISLDRVRLAVTYTAAPAASVTPRSRAAIRSWRGVR